MMEEEGEQRQHQQQYSSVVVDDDDEEEEVDGLILITALSTTTINSGDENHTILRTTSTTAVNHNKRNDNSIILYNFICMSILFSLNHGCVVACLGLATARLGNNHGAIQSCTLYLFYTGSALLGSTYVVKQLGSKIGTITGMAFYCTYVGAFYIATIYQGDDNDKNNNNKTTIQLISIIVGAAIGGIGAGFIWTGQGSYFANAAELYYTNNNSNNDNNNDNDTNLEFTDVTAKFAGIFAFIYLTLEVSLRLLSSILLELGTTDKWSTIFAIYSAIAIISTFLMIFIQDVDTTTTSNNNNNNDNNYNIINTDNGNNNTRQQQEQSTTVWYKITAAVHLLYYDNKMKYMIGLNSVFGFTAAFLNSYVNGNVVDIVLHDNQSKYVGMYTAWISCIAAVCSLLFGQIITPKIGKGPILVLGAICFAFVAIPFLLYPNVQNNNHWDWISLLFIYTMHGIGRATFEGTLKSTFADYFSYEKEGAFANIILQNGLASAVGYILSIRLLCQPPNNDNMNKNIYCVEYHDGTYHDLYKFELLIVITAIVAIVGYWRASVLHQQYYHYYHHEYNSANDENENENTNDHNDIHNNNNNNNHNNNNNRRSNYDNITGMAAAQQSE